MNTTPCQKYPWQLEGLNWVEEQVIARAHYVGCVIKLTNNGRIYNEIAHTGTIGHFTAYRQDPSAISNILPDPEFKLYKVVTVTWVGKSKMTKDTIGKYCAIRVDRVLAALVWLKCNNPTYRDVTINLEMLKKWGECGNQYIDPDLFAFSVNLQPEDAPGDHESYVVDSTSLGYENDLAALQPDAPDGTLISSTLLLPSEDLTPDPESIFATLAHNLDQIHKANAEEPFSIGNIGYTTTAGKEPMSIYTDKDYLTAGFPTLFPFGTGGHLDERPTRTSLKEFVKWALQHHHRRFARHMTFIFLNGETHGCCG